MHTYNSSSLPHAQTPGLTLFTISIIFLKKKTCISTNEFSKKNSLEICMEVGSPNFPDTNEKQKK